MGMLVDGIWTTEDNREDSGDFRRKASSFRHWITADGSPGPTGSGGFKADGDRYHLYVSLACPWAHRTLIYRALKGLESIIPVSVTHWHMGAEGWPFTPGPGVVPDPVNGAAFVHQIYTAADPTYTGRCSVPVLWDRQSATIVSNESADIIRMFETAFDELGATPGNLRPVDLRNDIDTVNERIYETLNNGVYRCGFATTQAAYDAAVGPLFDTLDWLESRLASHRYLFGDQLTEADWRLFPTLVRFDAVYHGHFKCSRRRLVDFPNLWAYARDLYQHPGIAGTVNLEHIRKHYYGSQVSVNPTGIVADAPVNLDFAAPHSRGSKSPN